MRYILLLIILGCGEKGSALPPLDEEDKEQDTNEPDDTPPQGTDEDGDGFTVENGDCDDDDPWTNPARDEEAADMIDNDCDGRVDEKWSGVTVALQDPGGSRLATISNIGGEIEQQLNLSSFGLCTDSAYLDQVSCEAASLCFDASGPEPEPLAQYTDADSCALANAVWFPTWEDVDAMPTYIDHADKCSDGRFIDQNVCEASSSCSDSQYTTQSECESAGMQWEANTWSKGWVFTHGGFGQGIAVVEVSSTGQTSVLTQFLGQESEDVFAVITHPDGYYIASRGNQLVKITNDLSCSNSLFVSEEECLSQGTCSDSQLTTESDCTTANETWTSEFKWSNVSVLVEWDAEFFVLDEEGNPVVDEDGNPVFNPDYELFSWSIARDLVSGEIGIFGLYGGFATWSEAAGLTVKRSIDIETEYGVVFAYDGTSRDGGGWYSFLYAGESGEISIGKFNDQNNDWEVKAAWTEQDQSAQEFAMPYGITVNGDSEYGDYYVSADVATYSTVFRVIDRSDIDTTQQTPEISDLYTSNSQPNWTFFGIVSNYY